MTSPLTPLIKEAEKEIVEKVLRENEGIKQFWKEYNTYTFLETDTKNMLKQAISLTLHSAEKIFNETEKIGVLIQNISKCEFCEEDCKYK